MAEEWEAQPPDSWRIEGDEIHVWRIELDSPRPVLDRLRPLLSVDERARADRFLAPRHRDRFLVGRGSLRTLLGRYLDRPPEGLVFQNGPQGKPSLEGDGSSLSFNLTHSGGLALLAVTRERRVGIDLEMIRPMGDREAIVARFFSPREIAEFRAVPDDQKLIAFLHGWTRKEAYMKGTGEGLSLPLDKFDVSLTPGEPPRLLNVEGRPGESERWSLQDLNPAPDAIAALAAEGRPWRVRCFHQHPLGSSR